MAIPARANADAAACADAAERGQELRASRKLVDARERFVVCAQRECPAVVRDSCTEWLEDLDKRIPSFVVDAKDDHGRDMRDVSVTLDGSPVPASVLSVAMYADPGPHVVRCVAADHEPASEEILLREGEPLRVVSLTLRSTSLPPPPPTSEKPRRPFPILPVSLGALSVVSLGVFGVVGATAVSDYNSLNHDCAPRCSSDQIDSVRTRFLVADIALVVGVLAGAAAVGLWILDRPSDAAR
jgi:hypothetical protein